MVRTRKEAIPIIQVGNLTDFFKNVAVLTTTPQAVINISMGKKKKKEIQKVHCTTKALLKTF